MLNDMESAPTPSSVTASAFAFVGASQQPKGMRKNGKTWHDSKQAFRPTAGLTSYAKRKEDEKAKQATKVKEQEMKEEKVEERNRRVQAIKDRRKAKEEKERYEKMAEKMHRKLVERRKRREKRNKLLHSGK